MEAKPAGTGLTIDCPACGAHTTARTAVGEDGRCSEPQPPELGNTAMCADCGQVLVWDDPGAWRILTVGEFIRMPACRQVSIVFAMQAWVTATRAIQRRRAASN